MAAWHESRRGGRGPSGSSTARLPLAIQLSQAPQPPRGRVENCGRNSRWGRLPRETCKKPAGETAQGAGVISPKGLEPCAMRARGRHGIIRCGERRWRFDKCLTRCSSTLVLMPNPEAWIPMPSGSALQHRVEKPTCSVSGLREVLPLEPHVPRQATVGTDAREGRLWKSLRQWVSPASLERGVQC